MSADWTDSPHYIIGPTPAGFLGAHAVQDIPRGTLVLREQPLFTIDAPLQAYLYQRQLSGSSGPTPVEGEEEDSDSEDDEGGGGGGPSLERFLDKAIRRQLSFKPRDKQDEFWELANTRPEYPRAYGIFATNAVS